VAKDNTWLWLAGGAAVVAYFAYQQSQANAGASAAGTPFYSTTPTPLSIYPEFAYTATTSMASTPGQQASTAKIPQPISYWSSVQEQEQAALLTQCAGAFPGCTPMMGDTQLGF
jgi:hypothetical protein